MPFNYWTQGAAVAEVELDCLTGDFEVRRADVLVDLGCSINPALDVGQIEGAFVHQECSRMGCVPSKEELEQMQREKQEIHEKNMRKAKIEPNFEQRLKEKREKNIREAKAKELPRLQVKGHKVVAYGATYAQSQTH